MKKTAKRIVLVEDEPTMANLIEAGLKKEGYEVQSAKDGKEGLRLIREVKPDLVLLDIMLPGMKGFEILKKLHEEDHMIPDMPVIIISNSGDSIEVERALKMGVRDYLIKVNFNPEEVVEKVKAVLEKEKKPKTESLSIKQILLIEDDILIAELLVEHLEKEGFNVALARDAETGMRKIRENRPKLILLDLVLPGIDGFEFLKNIKADKELASIPVIILSNLGQKSEVERGIKLGAEVFLVKASLDLDEIFQRIKQSLEKIQ